MKLPPLLELLRPHQWVKNGLVAAPLFFTPEAVSVASIINVALAIACFCAISSSVYILNDYMDREADRAHPVKNTRPLAAGTVPVPLAFITLAILVGGGLGGAFVLSPSLAGFIGVYFVMNLAYSFGLKKVSLIDVMIIAMGFILRVEGGAAAIAVEASVWIMIMTGLGALFIAMAKRRDDLVRAIDHDHRKSLDGYSVGFLDTANSIIIGALLVAYLIYCTDAQVIARMGTADLYYTAPFVVLGLLRYMQITIVEERSGSPTRVILTDKFLLVTGAAWAATFAALIYV